MGNRAVITTTKRDLGVYVHWNGGRDSVEAFLRYCELQRFRPPETDDYGWARLCQVIANVMGPGGLSVGIFPYADDDSALSYGSDNGVYVTEGWRIVDRVYPWDDFEEQSSYDLGDMLRLIDNSQPEEMRLGEFLDSEEVPVGEVMVGDMVWLHDFERWVLRPVVGIGDGFVNGRDMTGVPYTDMYRGYIPAKDNCNNYPDGDTVRVQR